MLLALLLMLLDQLAIVLVLMLVGAVFPVFFAKKILDIEGQPEFKIQIKL